MAYDSKCKELAAYFLHGRVPDDVLDSMASDLAQELQNTVEDFDDGTAAIAVKRELRKRARPQLAVQK